jgi:hypothetical protein
MRPLHLVDAPREGAVAGGLGLVLVVLDVGGVRDVDCADGSGLPRQERWDVHGVGGGESERDGLLARVAPVPPELDNLPEAIHQTAVALADCGFFDGVGEIREGIRPGSSPSRSCSQRGVVPGRRLSETCSNSSQGPSIP